MEISAICFCVVIWFCFVENHNQMLGIMTTETSLSYLKRIVCNVTIMALKIVISHVHVYHIYKWHEQSVCLSEFVFVFNVTLLLESVMTRTMSRVFPAFWSRTIPSNPWGTWTVNMEDGVDGWVGYISNCIIKRHLMVMNNFFCSNSFDRLPNIPFSTSNKKYLWLIPGCVMFG